VKSKKLEKANVFDKRERDRGKENKEIEEERYGLANVTDLLDEVEDGLEKFGIIREGAYVNGTKDSGRVQRVL
jgi:hypothetical protein